VPPVRLPTGPLRGILGVEDRPLVSVNFLNNNRSASVDGPSTLVVNGTQLKVFAWYDNEWVYSCRLADLASHIAALEGADHWTLAGCETPNLTRVGGLIDGGRDDAQVPPFEIAAIRHCHRKLLDLHAD